MIRLACLFMLCTALPAQACRLALVLAMDISSSVDAAEREMQIEGLATALEDEEVQAALFSIPGQPVALMVFEWSGSWDQTTLVDWSMIHAPADIPRLTAELRAAPRSHDNLPTAMGHALIHARAQFADAPACAQRKIDVSGDGRSNDGVRPERVYDLFDWGDITVNGLAIESDERALSDYYRGAVIHGPDAFVETAKGFETFAEAMRRKLLRELGVMQLGLR